MITFMVWTHSPNSEFRQDPRNNFGDKPHKQRHNFPHYSLIYVLYVNSSKKLNPESMITKYSEQFLSNL